MVKFVILKKNISPQYLFNIYYIKTEKISIYMQYMVTRRMSSSHWAIVGTQ